MLWSCGLIPLFLVPAATGDPYPFGGLFGPLLDHRHDLIPAAGPQEVQVPQTAAESAEVGVPLYEAGHEKLASGIDAFGHVIEVVGPGGGIAADGQDRAVITNQ